MRESKIEKEVIKYAETLGWLVYKFTSPGLRGVPDRLFLKNGTAIFIEFKATNKHPSRIQVKRMQEIMKAGFRVHYINTIEKGIALFNHMEEV